MGVAVGQGRRSRSTSLHVLLLVLVVLGVTPDRLDVSSLMLIPMSCLVSAGPDGLVKSGSGGAKVREPVTQAADASGQGLTIASHDAEEPALGEVGEFPTRETCWGLLGCANILRHLGAPETGLTLRFDPTELSGHCRRPINEDWGSARIDLLCRLTC